MTRFARRDVAGGRRSFHAALDELADADVPHARWWRGIAQGWLGKLLLLDGDLAGASEALDTCLRTFAELDNLWGLGLFIGTAAELRYAEGDLDAARRLAERSVVLLERVGFLHALAPVSVLLAAIAGAEADAAASTRWTARAVALYRDLGDEVSAAALEAEASRAGA